jgi:hypothetical protein
MVVLSRSGFAIKWVSNTRTSFLIFCRVKHQGGAIPKIMVHSHLMFKLVLNENLGGILGGIQCQMGDSLMLSKRLA